MPARVKVGILSDVADFTDTADGVSDPTDMAGWIEREVAALQDQGRLDAQVEVMHAYALGLPTGTAEAVEQAYRQLATAGANLIIGPVIGDNALVATPLAEHLRVPTINSAASDRARGRWMFQHQFGSLENEAPVIARYLFGLGQKRVAVLHEMSPSGTRHMKQLIDEARVLGMTVVADAGISPLGEEAPKAIENLLRGDVDAFVYLGAGLALPPISHSLSKLGWSGPRITNSAGLIGYRDRFAAACEGWAYLDMYSDSNATLREAKRAVGASDRQSLAVAKGYDLGRLVADAFARAPDLSREGIRHGLEQVRWLPAAEGHEGTLLGFGAHDRGALHGRFLVLRQWTNGESRELA